MSKELQRALMAACRFIADGTDGLCPRDFFIERPECPDKAPVCRRSIPLCWYSHFLADKRPRPMKRARGKVA